MSMTQSIIQSLAENESYFNNEVIEDMFRDADSELVSNRNPHRHFCNQVIILNNKGTQIQGLGNLARNFKCSFPSKTYSYIHDLKVSF